MQASTKYLATLLSFAAFNHQHTPRKPTMKCAVFCSLALAGLVIAQSSTDSESATSTAASTSPVTSSQSAELSTATSTMTYNAPAPVSQIGDGQIQAPVDPPESTSTLTIVQCNKTPTCAPKTVTVTATICPVSSFGQSRPCHLAHSSMILT